MQSVTRLTIVDSVLWKNGMQLLERKGKIMANPKFKLGECVRIKEQCEISPVPPKSVRGKCGIVAVCAGSDSRPVREYDRLFTEYTHFAYWVNVEGKQAHRIIEEWLEPCK